MAKRIFEDEIGGVEKVPNGKRGKSEKGDGKSKKPKRGGVRRMPHASEEPALFGIPTIPDGGPAISKDDGEISSETPAIPVETTFEAPEQASTATSTPTEAMSAAKSPENNLDQEKLSAEKFKEKYGPFLDRDLLNKKGDSIRIVSKFYDEVSGKVGVWFNLAGNEKGQKKTISIDELEKHLENFKPKEAKNKKISVKKPDTKKSKPFNGQFLADEAEASSQTFMPGVYRNGSIPHDAEEVLKERPKKKGEQKAEKELDPEELKIVIEDIEGAWKDLVEIYQEDEDDRILILKGKIAGYGKRQLVSIFGVSKEQATKIVGEVIDKIMSK